MPMPEDTLDTAQARKAIEEDARHASRPIGMEQRKNGIVAGGTVAHRLREHLLAHKLLEPIHHDAEIKDDVTSEFLANEASRLIQEKPYLKNLFVRAEDGQATRDALLALDLPEQMRFKLAAARAQKPPLFEHMLLVSLISQYLALRLGLSSQDSADLLIAALLHDIGELHSLPTQLDDHHRLSNDEMRYVYVHPVTGYLIAQAVAPHHPHAATAVLQHHERCDGSGYPNGLHEKSLTLLARIIGVADACASILARFGSIDRLNTLLRLGRKKYDPALIALLQEGFRSQEDSETPDEIVALPELLAAANLLKRWGAFQDSLTRTHDNGKVPEELKFLYARMDSVHSMLLQFGFDPDNPEGLLTLLADDKKIANELAAALNEISWQCTDLQRETIRHRNAIKNTLSVEDNRVFDAWLIDLQAYLDGAHQLPLGHVQAPA